MNITTKIISNNKSTKNIQLILGKENMKRENKSNWQEIFLSAAVWWAENILKIINFILKMY